MKILLINDYGTQSGGAELQMLSLREHLRERGHQVRLLTSDARLVEGFDVLADRTCTGSTNRRQVLSQTVNFSAVKMLRRELREYPPDVVHLRMFLWQISPAILPLLRSLPVLFQAAVYKAICPTGLKIFPDGSHCQQSAGLVCLRSGCVHFPTWASTMVQLSLLKHWRDSIDVSATLSHRMSKAFDKHGWHNTRVLPNGIDESPPRPSLSEPPTLAFAGRLSREKGIGTLLDAFEIVKKKIPTARLLIAGTGPLEDEVRRRIERYGDRAVYAGHLSRSEMEEVFGAAWAQVIPSLWHEPFGNVTLEAMMRGTAVIASDVGAQNDIVSDGICGHLVPRGNVSILAQKICSLLSDRALSEKMGKAGRDIALSKFSREHVVDELVRAYEDTQRVFNRRHLAL